ncbi:MAG: putative Ig domain-containing protein [Sandaracinaceae bacterium]
MQRALSALIVVSLTFAAACGTDPGTEDAGSTDAGSTGAGSTGAGSIDGGLGSDAGQVVDGGDADVATDGGGDAATAMSGYAAVGTPTTHAAGRGEPPVVAWPKPAHAHPDVPFEFTMVAYDPDHDRLIFSLEGAPTGMEIDANGTITWEPTVDGSSHSFTVGVDDGRGEPVTVPVTLAVDASLFVFVAPEGAEGATGTIDAPLADVDAAMRALTARDEGTLLIRGGTYDITWNWEVGGVTSPFRNTDGTPDAPYVVRGYPGESVVLDCGERGHGLWTFGGSYILHADIEVRGAAADERGGAILSGSHNVFQNVTVRDSNWSHTSNCTGFLMSGNDAVCHRCVAMDNYDRESEHWNSSNYLVYTDRSVTGTVYIIDSFSSGSISGFKMKHAGEGRLVLHGNREVGSTYGWGGTDDGTTIRFNTFEDNDTGLSVAITDPSASTRGGMLMEYNTVVGASRAFEVSQGFAQDGVTSRRNVFMLERTPGSGESEPHYTWIHPWQDAPSASILASEENCFFGPADDTGFRFGRATGGFVEWRALGFDDGSRFADPMFVADSYAPGPSSACREAATRIGAWD